MEEHNVGDTTCLLEAKRYSFMVMLVVAGVVVIIWHMASKAIKKDMEESRKEAKTSKKKVDDIDSISELARAMRAKMPKKVERDIKVKNITKSGRRSGRQISKGSITVNVNGEKRTKLY